MVTTSRRRGRGRVANAVGVCSTTVQNHRLLGENEGEGSMKMHGPRTQSKNRLTGTNRKIQAILPLLGNGPL